MGEIWQTLSSSAHRFLSGNPVLAWALGLSSVVMFVGTILLVPWLVARLPADHFVRNAAPKGANKRSPRSLALVLAKNLLGAMMVLVGIAMLVLPGQGALTILLGIMLLDVPGKRKLERRIATQRHVRKGLAWMRRRTNKPPLEFDSDG